MDDIRKPRHIVGGQRVSSEKKTFARQQRKEMSPVERVLWNRLRSNQIAGAHFRRQQVIAGFVADFYCHSAGLATGGRDAGGDAVPVVRAAAGALGVSNH